MNKASSLTENAPGLVPSFPGSALYDDKGQPLRPEFPPLTTPEIYESRPHTLVLHPRALECWIPIYNVIWVLPLDEKDFVKEAFPLEQCVARLDAGESIVLRGVSTEALSKAAVLLRGLSGGGHA